jgi:hypothetical protein
MLLADLGWRRTNYRKRSYERRRSEPDFTYGLSNTFTGDGSSVGSASVDVRGGKILNINRIRTEAEPRANNLA